MNRRSILSTMALAHAAIAAGCSSAPLPVDDAPAGMGGAPTAPASAAPSRDEWRREMSKRPPPKDGCFRAAHPSMEWEEVPCATPPAIPLVPGAGARRIGAPETVGGGADYVASVSGTISWSEGSFPIVSGVTSITDGSGDLDNFSVQLNSNFFWGPAACSGAANPSNCAGWEQYVYVWGYVFIQYWLVNYQNTCPAGWMAHGGDCYRNSDNGALAPAATAATLHDVVVTGTAGSSDTMTVSVGDGNLYTFSEPSHLGLNQVWTSSELNVFGFGSGAQAVFNSGSTVLVQNLTNGPSTGSSAPTCGQESTTGETNSLNLLGALLLHRRHRARDPVRREQRRQRVGSVLRGASSGEASRPRSRAARTTSATCSARAAPRPTPRATSGGTGRTRPTAGSTPRRIC